MMFIKKQKYLKTLLYDAITLHYNLKYIILYRIFFISYSLHKQIMLIIINCGEIYNLNKLNHTYMAIRLCVLILLSNSSQIIS